MFGIFPKPKVTTAAIALLTSRRILSIHRKPHLLILAGNTLDCIFFPVMIKYLYHSNDNI